MSPEGDRGLSVEGALSVLPVHGVPLARPGDDLAELVSTGLSTTGLALEAGDVVCVASTLLSRCEGRYEDLSQVRVGPHAAAVARATGKEPALVELVLREASSISRQAPGVLLTRHRLGHTSANSGVDRSNAQPPDAPEGSGPWALLLPVDPDASARALRAALEARGPVPVGVVITDSCGRPQRLGTVGLCLGLAGLPALTDHRGRPDLHGRLLQASTSATGDQVAALADLVMGQADEGRAVVVVRGLRWEPVDDAAAHELHRPLDQDLYR